MSNFWKFAGVLERDFGVSYDRDREVVFCPECKEAIVDAKYDYRDYASAAEDGYVVYRCPVCGKWLTCRPIEV